MAWKRTANLEPMGIVGYALVEFKENDESFTSVIPARMIKWTKRTKPTKGEEVIVCCDGEEHVATFHFSGIETTCKKRQRDMEKELNEDDLDKENEPPCAPGKTTRKRIRKKLENSQFNDDNKSKNGDKGKEKRKRKKAEDATETDDFIVYVGKVPPRDKICLSTKEESACCKDDVDRRTDDHKDDVIDNNRKTDDHKDDAIDNNRKTDDHKDDVIGINRKTDYHKDDRNDIDRKKDDVNDIGKKEEDHETSCTMDDIIHDQVDRDRMNSTTGSRSTADDRMDFSSDWENNFSHSGDRWEDYPFDDVYCDQGANSMSKNSGKEIVIPFDSREGKRKALPYHFTGNGHEFENGNYQELQYEVEVLKSQMQFTQEQQEINYDEIKRDIATMKADIDFIKRKVSVVRGVTPQAQPQLRRVDTTPTSAHCQQIVKKEFEETPNSVKNQSVVRKELSTSPAFVQSQKVKVVEKNSELHGNESGSELQTEDETDKEGLIPPERLSQLFIKSCSRQNFAVNLVRELFTEDTRKVSNVSGRLGKQKLDVKKMEYVQATVFRYHGCLDKEKEARWKECVVMIDESNRRLNNKPKKHR